MSSHIVLSSFPVNARLHPKVTHAKDILSRDIARAKKVIAGMHAHGPLVVQEALLQRHHPHHGETPPSEPSSGLHSIDVTDATVTYTMPVEVGTPPESFTLLIDTGSSNTWIGADKHYRPSSTAQNTRHPVNVSYGSGRFSGSEYIDRCKLGEGLVIEKQSIGVASSATGFHDVDGILGIGPVDLTTGTVGSTPSVPTITDNLFKQKTIGVESIGCYYAPTTDDTLGKGELSFGGPDKTKYTGEIVYVPITKTTPASRYWGVDQELTYGSETIMEKTAGIVDTGTTLVLLPSGAFEAYKKATGATMDEQTGLLSVTDEQYEKMESLNFKVGNTTLEMTKNAQIWPRSMNAMLGGEPKKIYLVSASIGEIGGQGLDFIDGFTFLQRFYTEYDTTNCRVGFAHTEHTNDTSN